MAGGAVLCDAGRVVGDVGDGPRESGRRHPAAAVYAVLGSLDGFHDPELTKVVVFLADGPEGDLRRQLLETRRKLASEGTGYHLSIANLRQRETTTGVTVTVDVSIVYDVPGTLMFMESQKAEWTIDTVHDRALTLSPGWKVASLRIPDICTVYTRC